MRKYKLYNKNSSKNVSDLWKVNGNREMEGG